MTHQSKQWAVTAINIAEAPSTKQEIEEAKRLRRHWMRTYPQRKLQLFSDISGVAIEDLVKEAVDEWLNSNKDFHIMSDHPQHGVPILGGMWGARNKVVFNLYDLAQDYTKGDYWQVNQNFLREKIYPLIKENNITHDEFFDQKPFPSPREGGLDHEGNPENFVGKPVDQNDERIR